MQVGLGCGHSVLDGDPAPQFSAYICCSQMAGWIKMPLGMDVGLGPGDFVLDGDPAHLSPKRGQSPLPNFRPMFIVAKRLDGSIIQYGSWHGGRPQPRQLCVRWGPSSPSQTKGPSQFSAHFCCGQTAGCIKMPLGMEVGLITGDIVLDGDPAHSPKRGWSPKNFLAHVYCGQTAGWIKMALGTEVGLGSGHIVQDRGPNSPSPKGGRAPPPIFGPFLQRAQRIASAVLATAIPSVCLSVRLSVCLSVTRRYCVKTTARSTVQFAPLDSTMCLVL